MSDRLYWWHWQNLNERPRGLPDGSILRHGRAWWHTPKYTLGWCWQFFSSTCGIAITIQPDNEATLSGHIALPYLFAFYVHIDTRWKMGEGSFLNRICKRADQKYGNPRGIGIRVFDWGIWWSLWNDEHESRHDDPWWQHGVFHPIDFVFGRRRYVKRVYQTLPIMVPMPEATYPGIAEFTEETWTRPWWPWWPLTITRLGTYATMSVGIPVPGKGENSYDCGEDAIHGYGSSATKLSGVIADGVKNAMETRLRHGGASWRPAERKEQAV